MYKAAHPTLGGPRAWQAGGAGSCARGFWSPWQSGTHIAAVVNEACEVATLGGIDDGVMIHPEHVAAPDALILVAFLPHVRDHLDGKRP